MLNDDLTLKGTLSETTVPDLFRSLIRSSETATVTLEAFGHRDSIYLHDGRIVSAATSDPDFGLADVLLRGGELNIEQYEIATESSGAAKRLGALLCELGYLQPEGLMRAVERQVLAIVLNAFAYREGNYTIEFTSEVPKEIVSLALATDRLVLDAVGRIEQWSLVRRGISRLERVLRQTPNADSRIYHLDLTEEESHIYALFSQSESIATICERSYLNNFRTCRTIWALLTANLLEDAEAAAMNREKADVENELELEALVERYNGAMQSLFGVLFQAIGDHVYDFVDRVVVNLSPESMPYLSGVNLMNEGRVDFDQLLNNLISSGSEDRLAVVTTLMNELLYAWVFEIKKEFGTKLDAEVVPIVDSLRR